MGVGLLLVIYPLYSKVGKHVTCDVIFALIRAQPYWKLYPYAVSFMLFLFITQLL